jgi:lysozyme
MAYDLERWLAEMERDEGKINHVYDDATGKRLQPGEKAKGHETIGIGRNLNARPLTEGEKELLRQNRPDLGERDLYRDGLSDEETYYLLNNDRIETERELDKRLPWWRDLSDTRQRAVLNMAFNLGTDGLLGFRKMLGALEAGDFEKASAEAIDSKWAGQVGQRRSGDIANMLLNDKAPVIPAASTQFASDAPEPIELPTLPGGLATQPVNPQTGEVPELEQPLVSTAALEEGMTRDPRTGPELAADIGKEPATDVATSADLVSLPKKGRIVVPGMEQQELHDPHTGPE